MALKFINSDPSTLNLDTLIHIETVLNDFAKYSIKEKFKFVKVRLNKLLNSC